MKKTKPKNMLKRKKNEGLVAYFDRWVEQGGADTVVVQPSKWGPICVSSKIYRQMNEALK